MKDKLLNIDIHLRDDNNIQHLFSYLIYSSINQLDFEEKHVLFNSNSLIAKYIYINEI